MSPAERPVIAWLKVRVSAVVVTVAEPLAVKVLNVTGVSPPPVSLPSPQAPKENPIIATMVIIKRGTLACL
jgi:hypothetical protein